MSISQQKIEPLQEFKGGCDRRWGCRGQALQMSKMSSGVSVMTRISKLLSFWVLHTVQQVARPLPPGKGKSVWAGPPAGRKASHSSLTLVNSFIPCPRCVKPQWSLILAWFFFYKSRLPVYWKEVSAGIPYKTIFSVPHSEGNRGLRAGASWVTGQH